MVYIKSINKKKIINDPVYGFINIPSKLIFNIIEHRYFQRLRRIRQLGLSNYIYPGANHTRFQHSVGAMYLMQLAVESLRNKKIDITGKESKAVNCAILMHDIGHGPFSHTLEYSILENVSHEDISAQFMSRMNDEFDGKLALSIKIFNNQYNKKFLHQLVSSQLDMDRLDYLRRDSFFSGVIEGHIGSDRIIKMLNVDNDRLVVEAKGIYSVEKFLIARRIMYWQVYLHKTAVAAEQMLVRIFRRAKHLASNGVELFATPALRFFLYNRVDKVTLFSTEKIEKEMTPLDYFAWLDDSDVLSAVKVWTRHSDNVLSFLSTSLINRNLFAIEIENTPFQEDYVDSIKQKCLVRYNFTEEEMSYIVYTDILTNNAYCINNDKINIKCKDNTIKDIAEASDISNVSALSKIVKKHFICYPKPIREIMTKNK